MSATKSDVVGWIVAGVLCVAMAIFVLWPSLRKKASGGNGTADYKPAQFQEPHFDAAGNAAAGAPVDELNAPRLAVGAVGMPAPAPSSPVLNLRQIGPPII